MQRILLLLTTCCEIAKSTTCGPNELEVLYDNQKSGIFHSPGWPHSYKSDSRCLFRFIAPPGRKVLVEFSWFHVAGLPPSCQGDFLDIYIDVASSRPRTAEDAAYMAYLHAQSPQTTTPFTALLYHSILAKSRLLGRYCGRDLFNVPSRLVSVHREIVFDFFTGTSSERDEEDEFIEEILGFNGTFKFISDELYYPGKVAILHDLSNLPHMTLINHKTMDSTSPVCLFVIEAGSSGVGDENSGEFVSPVYPGQHPPGLVCVYQLIGRPNQRVQVLIHDLYLQSQVDDACPTAFVQFYDGTDFKTAVPFGDRYCGERQNVQVVSTESSVIILFVTGPELLNQTVGVVNMDRVTLYRGFHVSYLFTDKLTPVDGDLKEKHIRGTECDFVIRSEGESEGAIESPNFLSSMTIAPNHSCTFFFLGVHQNHKLESVRIGFEILELPSRGNGPERCNEGSLSIYGTQLLNDDSFELHPRDRTSTEPSYDLWLDPDSVPTSINPVSYSQPSQIWCNHGENLNRIKTGRKLEMSSIVSWRTVLILRLNASGSSQSGANFRFRAIYKFTPDYAIPGKMIHPGKCWFQYEGSDSDLTGLGWTNSPLFENVYPPNMDCIYIFLPKENETVQLTFTTFQTNEPENVGGDRHIRQLRNCEHDFLEVFEVFDNQILENDTLASELSNRDPASASRHITGDALITKFVQYQTSYRFCGSYIPGPIVSSVSSTSMALVFHSDSSGTARGFQLNFKFISKTRLFPVAHKISDCGGNISSIDRGGVIQSSGYPKMYESDIICEWIISSQRGTRSLLLNFIDLSIEGSNQDCRNAVVRVYDSSHFRPSTSFCGTESFVSAYISNSTNLRIRFLTSSQATGAKGFKIAWTELLSLSLDKRCLGFTCHHTKYCISELLRCNGVANCGTFSRGGGIIIDDSDETTSCVHTANYSYLNIGIGALCTLFLLFCLVLLIFYKERKRKQKLANDPLSEFSSKSCSNKLNTLDNLGKSCQGLPNENSKPDRNFGYVTHQKLSRKSSLQDSGEDGHIQHAKSYANIANNNDNIGHTFHHCQHSLSQAHLSSPKAPKIKNDIGKFSTCQHNHQHIIKTPCKHFSTQQQFYHSEYPVSHTIRKSSCPKGHAHHIGFTYQKSQDYEAQIGIQSGTIQYIPMHGISHHLQPHSLSLNSETMRTSPDEENLIQERMQKISLV